MQAPLLATKFFVPLSRPELVIRPRLLSKLQNGLDRKVTLISAPAGFGKTTLLSNWVQEYNLPVVWLSLDEGDNSLERFLRYLVSAFQKGVPGVDFSAVEVLRENLLKELEDRNFEPVMIALVNDLVATSDRVIVVLDDYHLINDQSVNQALNFLVDHQPPSLHLVVATRADPDLPLPRWRARGELNEIRTDDLRFTLEEASVFLNQSFSLALTQEDVHALETRTEGWVAGLHMAALSLRNQEDPSNFVAEFTRSHRFVMDYLLEEVLNQQPEDLQTFLLHSAILDRLSGSLCDFITGRNDCQSVLEQLDRANLFIIPLDNERIWYRYHHLFANLLYRKLSNSAPDLLPELHRKASQWYAGEGLISEAIGHALIGGDIEGLEVLIEQNALAMIFHGELKTVLGWLESLPADVVQSRPWLSVAYAWVLTYAGKLDAVEQRLQDAEEMLALPKQPGIDGEEFTHSLIQSGILGQIDTIRAYKALLLGQTHLAEPFARKALEHLGEEDLIERSFAAAFLASALLWIGNLVEANEAALYAVELSRKAGESHVTVEALGILAGIMVHQGKLNEAYVASQEALQLAEEYRRRSGRQLPVLGLVYSRISSVMLRRNEIEKAVFYAREAVELAEQWQQTDIIFVAYLSLLQALTAQGDQFALNRAIEQAREIAREIVPYQSFITAVEAEINLHQGDLDLATQWAKQSGLSHEDEFLYGEIILYIILAKVLTARAAKKAIDLAQAEMLVDKLLSVTERAGATLTMINVLNLKAVLWYIKGNTDRALDTLEQALALGVPEGVVRNYIELGEPMRMLLLKLMERGVYADYARRLLAALDTEGYTGRDRHLRAQSELPEPLSERELQVLRLLPSSRSRAEIARYLYISVNTVRTHLKNIYSKLDVKSRQAAIQRGRELGLL